MKNFKKLLKEKFPTWDYERLEKVNDGFNGKNPDERIAETIYFLLCNKKGYYSVQNRNGEEMATCKYLKDAKYIASYDPRNVIVKIGSMDVEAELKELLTDEIRANLELFQTIRKGVK